MSFELLESYFFVFVVSRGVGLDSFFLFFHLEVLHLWTETHYLKGYCHFFKKCNHFTLITFFPYKNSYASLKLKLGHILLKSLQYVT